MREPTCINLTDRYGATYRVSWDPTYDPGHVPYDKRDPWYMQLSCERGTIYPHDGTMLAVEIDYRPRITAQVAALPGVVLYQDGDREKTFLFDVTLFDQVAEIVRPRRRRQVSEAERQRLAEMSRRFSPYRHAFSEHGSASAQREQTT